MKGYKAFNINHKGELYCQNQVYEVGKTYTLPKNKVLEICKNGFHFCPNLFDVFSYYTYPFYNRERPQIVVGEVEALGKTEQEKNKVVTDKIKIIRLYSLEEMAQLMLEQTSSNIALTAPLEIEQNYGYYNMGWHNIGIKNRGYYNTGINNIGERNVGYNNNGCENNGIGNYGYFNKGYYNFGNNNNGSFNVGTNNYGCCNIGTEIKGFFNTQNTPDDNCFYYFNTRGEELEEFTFNTDLNWVKSFYDSIIKLVSEKTNAERLFFPTDLIKEYLKKQPWVEGVSQLPNFNLEIVIEVYKKNASEIAKHYLSYEGKCRKTN